MKIKLNLTERQSKALIRAIDIRAREMLDEVDKLTDKNNPLALIYEEEVEAILDVQRELIRIIYES